MNKRRPSLFQRTVAESFGTFVLVFFGCGSVMVNAPSGVLGQLGVAAAFGLAVMAMVYALGHISGAHINPAVTIAFAVAKRFPLREVPVYAVGQTAGATVAAVILYLLLGDVANIGATSPVDGVWQSFAIEFVLSFVLMFVIMAVATDARIHVKIAGIAIGGTVMLEALVFGPITGASMNPARSIGPAFVDGDLSYLWLYCLAPVTGAMSGMAGYKLVRGTDNSSPGK